MGSPKGRSGSSPLWSNTGIQTPCSIYLDLTPPLPMQNQTDSGPKVSVEQISRQAGAASDLWVVGWRIQNLSEKRIELLTARLPHSQFRGEEIELAPPSGILAGESASLELSVKCRESPGSVVENAFLILRINWLGQSWLILARLRVLFDEQGAPQTVTEMLTTQPVGFSIQGGKIT